jgi:hypothetical protein
MAKISQEITLTRRKITAVRGYQAYCRKHGFIGCSDATSRRLAIAHLERTVKGPKGGGTRTFIHMFCSGPKWQK